MELVKREEHAVVEREDNQSRFANLVSSITAVFGRGQRESTKWTGLALLTYHLNPFNKIPDARQEFFDELSQVATNLQQAFRGGLFRRKDR